MAEQVIIIRALIELASKQGNGARKGKKKMM